MNKYHHPCKSSLCVSMINIFSGVTVIITAIHEVDVSFIKHYITLWSFWSNKQRIKEADSDVCYVIKHEFVYISRPCCILCL